MNDDTCADCGSLTPPFGVMYPGTPNGPAEYDMMCSDCGSLDVAESAREAAGRLGDKLDTARAENETLRAEVAAMREAVESLAWWARRAYRAWVDGADRNEWNGLEDSAPALVKGDK